MSQPAPAAVIAGSAQAQDDLFDEVENFHGVYLLVTTNPRYKGWTYIGYTVDPNRRIVQHNRGRRFGGACRTSNRGPWEMVLVVHGFPNDVSALRFEWAWQHPDRSRRLRGRYPAKKARVTKFQWLVSLLGLMLKTDPWCQLPLVVRWLLPNYKITFPVDSTPPSHMTVVEGLVRPKRLPLSEASSVIEAEAAICFACSTQIPGKSELMACFHCYKQYHCHCLASCFLTGNEGNIVPVDGSCPSCHEALVWGDLVRFKKVPGI